MFTYWEPGMTTGLHIKNCSNSRVICECFAVHSGKWKFILIYMRLCIYNFMHESSNSYIVFNFIRFELTRNATSM